MKYIDRVKLNKILLYEKDEKKLKIAYKALQKLSKLEDKEHRIKGGVYISDKDFKLIG